MSKKTLTNAALGGSIGYAACYAGGSTDTTAGAVAPAILAGGAFAAWHFGKVAGLVGFAAAYYWMNQQGW